MIGGVCWAYIYIDVYTHACMYVYACVYIYVYVYVNVNVYVYVYISLSRPFFRNDVGLLYVPGDTCRSAVATALATLVSGGRRETPPRSPSATALSALSRPSSTGSGSHAVPRELWRNGDFMGFHGV